MPRIASLFVLASASTFACAQFPHDKISLYKQYSLTELSCGNGNSCWGYVSPSGREYALMGCSNKLAVVEITDPSNSDFFASIPHSNGLWADVKVYKDVAYVVTENSGTGIQVIDLSQIDDHKVTLVKTVTSPGRSHTINIDPDSGFLYCVGTNEGTGTTMCFDLSDPRNPVRVGSNSLTGGNYVHECQVVTYKEGPYAGRQILFGGGTNRGMEIWDVTDKGNVKLVRRVSYPFVGYCHQGWLSPDRKYLYVNDEFDESQQGFNVRTLVFDVSVLETADLVATYSNDRPSIDHNIYVKNGFIFHSNYSSGFWIFDGNKDPKAPVYRGYFDTFPSDDRRDYVGTWSNWEFFPSGTAIVSDINAGLFILDVSDATKTPAATENALVTLGRVVGGGVPELGSADGKTMDIARGDMAALGRPPVVVTFEGKSPWTDVSKIQFHLRHHVTLPGLKQKIELYDWQAGAWAEAASTNAPTADTLFTVNGPRPDRFFDLTSKMIRARLTVTGAIPGAWKTQIDEAGWIINP